MRSTISVKGTTISGVQRRSFFERHELDEADDDVFFASKSGKALDFVVVESAQQDAVDFERSQPGVASGANTAQHLVKAARNARDALEGGGVDGVHADGDAIEPGDSSAAQQVCRAGGRWW